MDFALLLWGNRHILWHLVFFCAPPWHLIGGVCFCLDPLCRRWHGWVYMRPSVRPSHLVSGHYLDNHLWYSFFVGTVNSPKWPSDLISIPSHSSDFPPNAGLWLVNRFLAIISPTTHHIAFILKLWDHPRDPQTWLAYCHAPVIFRQMLACDWSLGFQPLSLQPLITLLPYWICELT